MSEHPTRHARGSGALTSQLINPGPYSEHVHNALKRMDDEQWIHRVWSKDAGLWKTDEAHKKIIENALGWIEVPEASLERAGELEEFAREVREAGFTHVLLLGMGGSSLCPEVFRRTFGRIEGFPRLMVLDSTDPATVRATEESINIERTLFIVASKSGTTTEPLMFYKYFFNRAREVKGERAGENFVAITDPGTLMESMARADNFRRIFLNPADIGGRYSALSLFGMVPAAVAGLDARVMLERTQSMMKTCSPDKPINENPAASLGALMGALAGEGRDKLTLVISSDLESLGLWIEQLVAESTGKQGRGIVPVAGEQLGPPEVYGDDRLFVSISAGPVDEETERRLRALESFGHPVARRMLNDALDLGQEFYVWEMATALAGACLGINPFDQPNVQESKDNTKRLLDYYKQNGSLPEQELAAESDGLRVYCESETRDQLGNATSAEALIVAHLKRAGAGDYVALLDYIQETAAHEQLIQQIRHHLRDALRIATTTGYGPRFLHSTGQLHKGGPPSGVFIQVTADDARDVEIRGEPFTFGVLKQAQALGDYESLASRGRRAIRVHIGQNVIAGLAELFEIIRRNFPPSG
jgi:glucose-6-phosphate isomerase